MSYEEELEALQEEALAEIEGNDNDTDTDDDQQEESASGTDDNREAEDDREDSEGDEGEDDFEDDEDLEDEDDSDSDEDEADDEDSDDEKNNSDFEPVSVTVNGQTITLNSQKELLQYVKNGNAGTQSKRSRKSKTDQIIAQGDLSESDLALLIDAKNGNKAAIAKLAKQSNVDIYELDEDLADQYSQDFKPSFMTEADEVAEDIIADEPLYTEFKKVVENVPQEFAEIIATDPKALKNFATHVKSGLAQKIIPEAIKAQMLQGGTFIENYARIGREITESEKSPEKSKTIRKKDPRAEKLKARAKNHKGSNKGTKTKVTGEDIWNMSSEDFSKKFM